MAATIGTAASPFALHWWQGLRRRQYIDILRDQCFSKAGQAFQLSFGKANFIGDVGAFDISKLRQPLAKAFELRVGFPSTVAAPFVRRLGNLLASCACATF